VFACRGIKFSSRALLFQRQGPFRLIWPCLYLKPPRLTIIKTEMMSRNQKRRLALRRRFPPVLAEDAGVDKKRKRVKEFASSSSAAADKASVPTEDTEYFDLLAS
jgi:hypothetical protein